MRIPLIDEKPQKYKVDRIKKNGPNLTDTAVEVEDEKTGEKKLKFKSDGVVIPKPGQDKISTTRQTSLWKKLKGERYTETLKFIDYGDGSGDFVEVDFEDGRAEASGNERMFQTHRSLTVQKISRLFSEEDNTQLWLAAYLTVLALVTVGAMFFVTQGIEDTVAQAVQQGIEAGLQSTQTAQQGVTGGG